MISLLALCLAAQVGSPDTLLIRSIDGAVPPSLTQVSSLLGRAEVRFPSGQGQVSVWLFRWRDTVFVRATIPDSTPYWGDDFVLSLDTRGDAASSPQHDDFQWYLRRTIDSSVVYRGRDGRWQPPRDDPDWRLGKERSGGGWEVSAQTGERGWSLLLRLDPAWFNGEELRLPRVAFRVYDNSPGGWFTWPLAAGSEPPTLVEHTPSRWIPLDRSIHIH